MIGVAARHVEGARQRLSARRELTRLQARLPALLVGTPAEGRLHGAQSAQWTRSGVAVFLLGLCADAPSIVVKATTRPGAACSLTRQHAALAELHALDTLGAWRALLPRPLAQRGDGELRVVVETALRGRPATAASGEHMLCELIESIRPLHERTSNIVTVDEQCLVRWIDAPVAPLASLDALTPGQRATLEGLRDRLRGELGGAQLQTSWIHGDFWPANVLVDGQSVPSGIVDWDRAAAGELALHDLLHTLLYSRKLLARRPLGEVVAQQLRAPVWSSAECRALGQLSGDIEQLTDASAVALYWLRHVAENLLRDPAYATNAAWLRGNVLPVLDALRSSV